MIRTGLVIFTFCVLVGWFGFTQVPVLNVIVDSAIIAVVSALVLRDEYRHIHENDDNVTDYH